MGRPHGHYVKLLILHTPAVPTSSQRSRRQKAGIRAPAAKAHKVRRAPVPPTADSALAAKVRSEELHRCDIGCLSKPNWQRTTPSFGLIRGGLPASTPQSFGDWMVIAAREGDHFDVTDHTVFDVDRSDVASVICVDEEHVAAVPEVLAVFFAGFNVQFQSLSSHFLILTLSVSMNLAKAGTKGLSARNLPREEYAGAGGFSC